MEEKNNIFGKCFICLTNSADCNLNVGLSLHFLCKYLKLDLKEEERLSEFSDLSVPLCPNCDKNLEKFNSLYQSLEKIKMEMDYQFELIKCLICNNAVNGYNDYWKSVAQLRQQILPKCLERRCRHQSQVKIKRISILKINFKQKATKQRDLFSSSILPNIKNENLEIPVNPECDSDDDDANPLESYDKNVEHKISIDDHIFDDIKIESGIDSNMPGNVSEPQISQVSNVNPHKHTHTERKYTCNICGRAFELKQFLNNHQKRLHGGYREICKFPGCKTKFARSTYMQAHIRQAHPELSSTKEMRVRNFDEVEVNGGISFQCKLCKAIYKHGETFHRHFKQVHGPATRYKCGSCGKSYSRKDSLTSHSRECSVIEVNGESRFQCILCKTSYRDLKEYRKHTKSVHPPPRHNCGCGKSYSTKTQLNIHLNLCRSKKSKTMERQCEYQPQVKIRRMSMLKINIKEKATKEDDSFSSSVPHNIANEDNLKLIVNPECDSDVSNPLEYIEGVVEQEVDIDDHILLDIKRENEINTIHSERKYRYVCNICGKAFQFKQMLNNHQTRLHGGYREICKVPECNKKFAGRPCLSAHVRTAHPEVPTPEPRRSKNFDVIEVNGGIRFQCKLCKAFYRFSFDFHRHFKQVHGPPTRYKCESCGKSYSRKDSLTSHTKICNTIEVNGEKMFQCTLCKKSYSKFRDYVRHINYAHGSPTRYKCERCGRSYTRKFYLKNHPCKSNKKRKILNV